MGYQYTKFNPNSYAGLYNNTFVALQADLTQGRLVQARQELNTAYTNEKARLTAEASRIESERSILQKNVENYKKWLVEGNPANAALLSAYATVLSSEQSAYTKKQDRVNKLLVESHDAYNLNNPNARVVLGRVSGKTKQNLWALSTAEEGVSKETIATRLGAHLQEPNVQQALRNVRNPIARRTMAIELVSDIASENLEAIQKGKLNRQTIVDEVAKIIQPPDDVAINDYYDAVQWENDYKKATDDMERKASKWSIGASGNFKELAEAQLSAMSGQERKELIQGWIESDDKKIKDMGLEMEALHVEADTLASPTEQDVMLRFGQLEAPHMGGPFEGFKVVAQAGKNAQHQQDLENFLGGVGGWDADDYAMARAAVLAQRDREGGENSSVNHGRQIRTLVNKGSLEHADVKSTIRELVRNSREPLSEEDVMEGYMREQMDQTETRATLKKERKDKRSSQAQAMRDIFLRAPDLPESDESGLTETPD